MFDCNVLIHNDLLCFSRLLCHYVYFGVAKVAAKIVQASGMIKQNTQFLFSFPSAAYLMKR